MSHLRLFGAWLLWKLLRRGYTTIHFTNPIPLHAVTSSGSEEDVSVTRVTPTAFTVIIGNSKGN